MVGFRWREFFRVAELSDDLFKEHVFVETLLKSLQLRTADRKPLRAGIVLTGDKSCMCAIICYCCIEHLMRSLWVFVYYTAALCELVQCFIARALHREHKTQLRS